MFSRKTPRPADNVLSHWYVLLEGLQFSTTEFYESIERSLVACRVPRLRRKRVEFHEGSSLSARRVYLRLARERFSFEVCAAPFGTGYFFSLRFVEIPRGGWIMLILMLLAVLLAGGALFALFFYMLFFASGAFWINSGMAALLALFISIAHEANRPPDEFIGEASEYEHIPDFDAFLLGLPVIGEWYERVRRDTYYRYDTRIMYHDLVSSIVKTHVEELVAANGVKLLKTHDYNPLADFYKVKGLKPGHPKEPPAHDVAW